VGPRAGLGAVVRRKTTFTFKRDKLLFLITVRICGKNASPIPSFLGGGAV
jgi:hypothetical protein